MKKAILLAAACGIFGLSSCCRIVDCCFEDPCAPASCSPCEMFNKKEKGCGPCGSYSKSCKSENSNNIQHSSQSGDAYNQ
ncbi:small cysteine-rich outer membrane protein omcA [Chlamydia ibidis]|uniref:Small cysteine-rich outer membrane protein OmcA n=2 Tax=Chlamydia ibidis TaxID=1405396 RepID=S7KLZ2_9CHLA|nr:small cysteine-rich outer membrane protein [Chlamydia ibidis]EPP35465.1 small cysteine-rich outer membrane protein omcA [Chlamydia ibidis]EQM62886.1 small cysteine-rich outer membrane protein omcA [Chlamydia ibidis 10-1398/6]